MRWLRRILRRRSRPLAPKCNHNLSKWVVPLLGQLGSNKPNGTLFLGLAELDDGHLKVAEDPIGFIRSLAKMTRKSTRQVFEECLRCAHEGTLIGSWRFFVVEEVYMGQRQQRLMANFVAYRSRFKSIPDVSDPV